MLVKRERNEKEKEEKKIYHGIRAAITIRLLGFKVIWFQLYLDCFGYMNPIFFFEQHILIVGKFRYCHIGYLI